MKKNYNGLDLLKFIMALMVVMIHVKPNAHSLFLTTVFSPLMSISVPVFFVVSSVLLFSQLGGAGYTSIINRYGLFTWFSRIYQGSNIWYNISWVMVSVCDSNGSFNRIHSFKGTE